MHLNYVLELELIMDRTFWSLGQSKDAKGFMGLPVSYVNSFKHLIDSKKKFSFSKGRQASVPSVPIYKLATLGLESRAEVLSSPQSTFLSAVWKGSLHDSAKVEKSPSPFSLVG